MCSLLLLPPHYCQNSLQVLPLDSLSYSLCLAHFGSLPWPRTFCSGSRSSGWLFLFLSFYGRLTQHFLSLFVSDSLQLALSYCIPHTLTGLSVSCFSCLAAQFHPQSVHFSFGVLQKVCRFVGLSRLGLQYRWQGLDPSLSPYTPAGSNYRKEPVTCPISQLHSGSEPR